MLMLFRIMQSFPFRGTRAAASRARELPRWSLLSMNFFHESVALSYTFSLHPSWQSSAYSCPFRDMLGLRQPSTIPLLTGVQVSVSCAYDSHTTLRFDPSPFKNHVPL
ncbi:hypothetical protein V8G54_000831 [Vigna mungo]|uniref:Uncharacterized protein n=1 Tax=Vigna mungo TaxID=3915 RepID=A0AAQ3P7L2_VIGMU